MMGSLRIPVLFLALALLTEFVVDASSSGLWDNVSRRIQSRSWTLAFRDSDSQQHGHLSAPDNLQESLSHQSDDRLWQVPCSHKHRESFKKQATLRHRKKHKNNNKDDTSRDPPKIGSLGYALRLGLAGGLGGAAGTVALFPMDTAKTLRQANPTQYKSALSALGAALYRDGQWHVARVYKGVIPSTLGAIPSSALYFGAYESMKRVLTQMKARGGPDGNGTIQTMPGRLGLHAASAASGNVLSSAIFVPKEAIKSQMQYMGSANVAQAAAQLCQTRGFAGLYAGYRATLLRNIPTAALRFALYEEFKHMYLKKHKIDASSSSESKFDPGLFAAGAMSGVFASALMTPVDVLKTRIATGTCPVDMSNCAVHVLKECGVQGLYAGVGSRMICSGLFSAIGFGVFEASKKWLGVSGEPLNNPSKRIRKRDGSKEKFQVYTPRQRRLDHAVSDALQKCKQ